MKTVIRILTIMVLANSVALAQTESGPRNTTVMVLAAKGDIFYFKVDRKLVGSLVEVFDIHDQLVGSGKLPTRKMLIDFYEMEPGNYHIKLTKGKETKELDYVKKGHTMVLTQTGGHL